MSTAKPETPAPPEEVALDALIMPDPRRRRDQALIEESGTPVWAIIAYLQSTNWDVDGVAAAYNVSDRSIQVAFHYYERKKQFIDAFLLLNSEKMSSSQLASFYLDENVAEAIALQLQALGHDALTTTAAGNKGRSDPQQLLFATATGRILVTCNRWDFTLVHETLVLWAARWGTQDTHAGILIVPQEAPAAAPETVRCIDQALTAHGPLAGRMPRWTAASGWTELAVTP